MSPTPEAIVPIPMIPKRPKRKHSAPCVADLFVYYENGKGFLTSNGEECIYMTETAIRRYLHSKGVSHKKVDMDAALLEIQMTKTVAYAGPLAGKTQGLHIINNSRVLVTSSPKLPPGDSSVPWPLLQRFFREAIGELQYTHQLGWLQRGRQAIRSGVPLPGQMLALCGEAKTGKTLIQTIYCKAMGGRSASPYAFMTGRSDFNRQLFGAECLSFGDEIASTDIRARRHFGANIKQFVANNDQDCHGKNKEAITLTPCWRIMMSCNREPENMLVLPEWNQSIADKIQLHLVQRPALFDSGDWSHDRHVNLQRLLAEFPGFLAAVDSFVVPEALSCERMGITHYHHPDLLAALDTMSEQHRLLDLIDGEIFKPQGVGNPDGDKPAKHQPWIGPATRMEARLGEQDSSVRYQAQRLLTFHRAATTYLSRLCNEVPHRVSKLKSGDTDIFTIRPPGEEAA